MQVHRNCDVLGCIVVMQHCAFLWRQSELGGPRVIEVEARHCDRCVAELRRLGVVIHDARPALRPLLQLVQ